MQKNPTALDVADNGGRRRVRDRRFLVSAPCAHERRTNWERRSRYDRRLRQIADYGNARRTVDEALASEG